MVINRYENSQIKFESLPISWQSQNVLDELADFLQQNWEQRSVFYEDGTITSKQQFIAFIGQRGIKTKNYIGTIVFKGEQINIFPKMFREDADYTETENLTQKHLMKNLVHWLEYCHKIEYPFINITTALEDTEDLRELFITLYIGYVRSALERGAYYQYVEKTEDCTGIKGKFDIKDYYINKIPNGQINRFRCSYSKFEYDNKVNRIIKYTCKQIMNSTTSKNQKEIRKILMRLDEVNDVPCSPHDCNNIRLSKMHRYYDIILSMSKMFLLNRLSNYTVDNNESFCFLFPTELLFEGFIGGFMQDVLSEYGAKVKLQQSEMHLIEDVIYGERSLGAAFTMRHDILVETKNKIFILDTKYKQVSRFEGNDEEVMRVVREEPKQTDIYQVCEYARKRGIQDAYLLYPMYRYEDRETIFPVGISPSPSGDIRIHFIRVPFVFEEDSEKMKEQLKSIILDIIRIDA